MLAAVAQAGSCFLRSYLPRKVQKGPVALEERRDARNDKHRLATSQLTSGYSIPGSSSVQIPSVHLPYTFIVAGIWACHMSFRWTPTGAPSNTAQEVDGSDLYGFAVMVERWPVVVVQ